MMKLKIMIMALLLVMVGIGSAVNYLPESTMKPGADLSMFSGDPGNIEMWSGTMKNATWYPAPFPHSVTVVNDNGTYFALTGNGSVISQDIDPAPVIQDAVDYCESNSPGSVLLGGYFDTSSATIDVDVTKVSISSTGGLSSGIYSSANPAIELINPNNDSFAFNTVLSDMRIIGPPNTVLVSFHPASDVHGLNFKNLYLIVGENGTGMNISNWRMGGLYNCYLLQGGETGYGINLTGSNTHGPMNIDISNCMFWGFKEGIKITSPEPMYTAGIRIMSSTVFGNAIGVNATGVNDLRIAYNMIDVNNEPIILDNINSFSITNNWISCKGDGKDAIKTTCVAGNVMFGLISGNRIGQSASVKGNGILLQKGTGGEPSNIIISMNHFQQGMLTGVKLYKSSGYLNYITIVDNDFSSTLTTGIHLEGIAFGLIADNNIQSATPITAINQFQTTIQNNRGYKTEASGSSIGTGAQQTFAHGLSGSGLPINIVVTPGETGVTVSNTWVNDTHLHTTVKSGKKFYWSADRRYF